MHGFPINAYAITDTVTDLKLNPASIIGGYVSNQAGTDAFVVFFDKPAAEVVLGTTAPHWIVEVYSLSQSPIVRAGEGIIFTKAISAAAVATPLGLVARTCDVHLVVQ